MRGASAAVAALLMLALLAWFFGATARDESISAPEADAPEAVAPAVRVEFGVAGPLPQPPAVVPAEISDLAPKSAERPAPELTPTVDTPEAGDPAGCVVFGRVTATSGARLEQDAYVVFRDAQDERILARAGEDGSYAASGLHTGAWLVDGSASGVRTRSIALELPEPGAVTRLDLELAPATVLVVRLTAPDGRPFFDALRDVRPPGPLSLIAVATAVAPGATFYGVEGSLDNPVGLGRFRYADTRVAPPGVLGELTVERDPPICVSLVLRSAVLETTQVVSGQTEVAFTLDPAALLAALTGFRLRLIAEGTGRPVAGAHVRLINGTYEGPPRISAADGVVVVEGREPGPLTVQVQGPGYALARFQLDLVPGETRDLGTLELQAPVRIAGRLVDESGAPVQGELEVARIAPDGSLVRFRGQTWRANARGEFRVDALEPGEYLLHTRARLGSAEYPDLPIASDNHVVSTRGGSVEGLELVLRPLGKVIFRHDRADYRDLRVELIDGRDLPRVSRRGLRDARQQALVAPHGTYRLRVTGAGGEGLVERDVVVGSEPTAVQIPSE
jgi:hypothetical protein